MEAIFLATWLGIVAAQIAPGPNMLAVAGVALSQGRLLAICVAGGVGTGVIIWVLAFAFGLSNIFHTDSSAALFMQLLGGTYLLYIGIKAMNSARNASLTKMRAAKSQLSFYQA
ncbi:MAG: threonine efflux protein [Parasphingorhabdus sp.]|jgi:threonine efflux protein